MWKIINKVNTALKIIMIGYIPGTLTHLPLLPLIIDNIVALLVLDVILVILYKNKI